MQEIRKIKGYYVCAIVTILLLLLNHTVYSPLISEFPTKSILEDFEKESLNVSNDMVKLLISLATALFAVIGYFVIEHFKLDAKVDNKYRLDLIISLCTCIISIDFGYVFMEKMSELLALGIFNIEDNVLTTPKKLQVLFFITSLFFTGRLILKISFKDET